MSAEWPEITEYVSDHGDAIPSLRALVEPHFDDDVEGSSLGPNKAHAFSVNVAIFSCVFCSFVIARVTFFLARLSDFWLSSPDLAFSLSLTILVAWADDFLEDAAGVEGPEIVEEVLAASLGRVSRTLGTPFPHLRGVSRFDGDAGDGALGPAKVHAVSINVAISLCAFCSFAIARVTFFLPRLSRF